MGGGLAFLTKKNFNPANWTNQKAVWEARQKKAQEEKAVRERQEQLKVEKEDEQFARARGGDRSGDQAALKFMYGAPPGLDNANDDDDEKKEKGNTDCHVGDDEAAAQFRKLFTAQPQPQPVDPVHAHLHTGTLLQREEAHELGDNNNSNNNNDNNNEMDTRTALEKAVGRKAATGLSLNDQIARFPHLKNAPMAEGMAGTNVHVTFKPLGASIRNIRCIKCGEWGHSKGERECKLSGWNPFQLSSGDCVSASASAAETTPHVVVDVHNNTDRTQKHDGDDDDTDEDESRRYRRRRHRRSKKSSHSENKKHKKHSKKSRKRKSYSRSRSPSRDRKAHKYRTDDGSRNG
eukprot:CAMPEP_0196802056 /NCGR_PEP_ID=MMETSP1362-20130617/1774_1 /TAXON_ID=163516 /ORGANISM="Leptocylindrus danicus, Strain CCMP1856" /LENGTH=347 /DNA_ID=CAMNT_0042173263 /DNA_START=31 /DNA_END=1074 /DNA_ORIENTATION=+